MQTVTVEINDVTALKALEDLAKKRVIRIVGKTDYDPPALPGKPLSISQFRQWIQEAEKGPTISLEEFKSRWKVAREDLFK